jgi:hypothetical protein
MSLANHRDRCITSQSQHIGVQSAVFFKLLPGNVCLMMVADENAVECCASCSLTTFDGGSTHSAWRINRSERSFAQQKPMPPRHRISGKPVRFHDVTAAINRRGSGKVSARDINRHELPAPAQQKAVGAPSVVIRSDNLPGGTYIERSGESTAGEIDRGEG